ncbi:MAG TPA: N-acetylmuramoyl-L-alanine amidase [Chloroflexia bacterium]|nr:N-acetylmuramoyl-L-alanine amidase [Chloroflexia bacterium]
MSGATRTSIIPASNANRPGIKLIGGKPEFLTIHETANTKPGANAEMHRKFVHQGGGEAGVSFHYVVDEKESIQLLPDDEVAWHAGDGRNGAGNNRSVAIEICVNKDGNFLMALANTVLLVVRLMSEFSIPLSKVVQHNHWSGKDCPHKLRLNQLAAWMEFRASLGAQERTFPETGKKVKGDFLKKWDSEPKAMEYWGFPITDEKEQEFAGVGKILVQYFQRARFERHPDGVVRLGLLGVEAVK